MVNSRSWKKRTLRYPGKCDLLIDDIERDHDARDQNSIRKHCVLCGLRVCAGRANGQFVGLRNGHESHGERHPTRFRHDWRGSVWIEYGNGADSTGAGGSSTIVQYSTSGAVQHTYSISGLADGLKFNPTTGMVWALQNNDANATLSIINPTTQTVSGPLRYGPPYIYTTPGPLARGYDDVAFLNGKVYLSYTNPVNPTDPVLQILNNGNTPTGTLTTTSILTAAQTGISVPEIDSLKSTPNGELVLTSEGDGAGTGNPIATFSLIANPGAANQTVTNVPVTDTKGNPRRGDGRRAVPGRDPGDFVRHGYSAQTKSMKSSSPGSIPTRPSFRSGASARSPR